MKEIIKKYFREDRSHNGGVALYMKYGNRLALKKQFNVIQPNAYITGVLHEELRQLAGLDQKEFQLIMSKPVVVKSKEAAPEIMPGEEVSPGQEEPREKEHLPVPPEKVGKGKKASRKK